MEQRTVHAFAQQQQEIDIDAEVSFVFETDDTSVLYSASALHPRAILDGVGYSWPELNNDNWNFSFGCAPIHLTNVPSQEVVDHITSVCHSLPYPRVIVQPTALFFGIPANIVVVAALMSMKPLRPGSLLLAMVTGADVFALVASCIPFPLYVYGNIGEMKEQDLQGKIVEVTSSLHAVLITMPHYALACVTFERATAALRPVISVRVITVRRARLLGYILGALAPLLVLFVAWLKLATVQRYMRIFHFAFPGIVILVCLNVMSVGQKCNNINLQRPGSIASEISMILDMEQSGNYNKTDMKLARKSVMVAIRDTEKSADGHYLQSFIELVSVSKKAHLKKVSYPDVSSNGEKKHNGRTRETKDVSNYSNKSAGGTKSSVEIEAEVPNRPPPKKSRDTSLNQSTKNSSDDTADTRQSLANTMTDTISHAVRNTIFSKSFGSIMKIIGAPSQITEESDIQISSSSGEKSQSRETSGRRTSSQESPSQSSEHTKIASPPPNLLKYSHAYLTRLTLLASISYFLTEIPVNMTSGLYHVYRDGDRRTEHPEKLINVVFFYELFAWLATLRSSVRPFLYLAFTPRFRVDFYAMVSRYSSEMVISGAQESEESDGDGMRLRYRSFNKSFRFSELLRRSYSETLTYADSLESYSAIGRTPPTVVSQKSDPV